MSNAQELAIYVAGTLMLGGIAYIAWRATRFTMDHTLGFIMEVSEGWTFWLYLFSALVGILALIFTIALAIQAWFVLGQFNCY